MARKQFVIFKINNESMGIEIQNVNSIEKYSSMYKVPDTPDFIEGLINLRDKVYTVFNLRKKFSLPDKEADGDTKIVIINFNNTMAGFIVDEVTEIIHVEEENLESLPDSISGSRRKYLTGIAKKGEKIILLLDLGRTLSLEEESAVMDFQRAGQVNA